MNLSAAVRVAVEGCGHGTLKAIYSSIRKSCEVKGWPGVDLLIIGGDFQAVRNSYDLNAMSVPMKYRQIGDFHEYYSGARTAPYLTLFIGGNHEASNHLSELFYGGWVAPNIYYLGAANVVRFGPLRIAGLSGIWKGYSYKKAHYERVPYNKDDVKSVYHVREIDTRKLLCVSSQIDIGLSHDWPRGVEWMGDWKTLFRHKGHLEPDARSKTLGSVAAKQVLDRLRPYYWFSAHLHCKYSAVIRHGSAPTTTQAQAANEGRIKQNDSEEVKNDNRDFSHVSKISNTADEASSVPQTLRDQLPASFRESQRVDTMANAPVPTAIQNTTTQFLALDKCLPNRRFLQLLEIKGAQDTQNDYERPYHFFYDAQWLAITRAFAGEVSQSTSGRNPNKDKGEEHYRGIIQKEMEWVTENVVRPGHLAVPYNFAVTAPCYDPSVSDHTRVEPQSYVNPQTEEFCRMLQIERPFS